MVLLGAVTEAKNGVRGVGTNQMSQLGSHIRISARSSILSGDLFLTLLTATSGRGAPADLTLNLELLTKRLFQRAKANQAAPYREEGFVNFGSFFVSDAQAPKLMQPGYGALDHPAQRAQTGAMGQSSPGQPALDAALS